MQVQSTTCVRWFKVHEINFVSCKSNLDVVNALKILNMHFILQDNTHRITEINVRSMLRSVTQTIRFTVNKLTLRKMFSPDWQDDSPETPKKKKEVKKKFKLEPHEDQLFLDGNEVSLHPEQIVLMPLTPQRKHPTYPCAAGLRVDLWSCSFQDICHGTDPGWVKNVFCS